MTYNVNKIAFNFGLSDTEIKNITEYSNLLNEYKSNENKISQLKQIEFEKFKLNIPQYYEKIMLNKFTTSLGNYNLLISDLNLLNYYKNNLNNENFNWANPNFSGAIANFTLANFTLQEISEISGKLNLPAFTGYEVSNIII